MQKLLILLVVAVVGWLLFKGLIKKGASQKGEASSATAPEKMLKCSRCGVFLPESETMQRDGEILCQTPERCLHRQKA
jgi:uncharacterized C2H2 Zn-finger protein